MIFRSGSDLPLAATLGMLGSYSANTCINIASCHHQKISRRYGRGNGRGGRGGGTVGERCEENTDETLTLLSTLGMAASQPQRVHEQ